MFPVFHRRSLRQIVASVMQVKLVSVFAHGCCPLVINYSQQSSETQCSMALRSEMSFYLKAQHLIILCSTYFFPQTHSTLQWQKIELKKPQCQLLCPSLFAYVFIETSHIWYNCKLKGLLSIVQSFGFLFCCCWQIYMKMVTVQVGLLADWL